MRVEPAHVNQVRQGTNGRIYEIDADVGHVAEDLRRVGCAGLNVRFAENGSPPCWIVFHENHSGCPRNKAGEGPHSTYLVTTAKAYQNRSGVWEGLDQRLVQRIAEIGHPSYDYVKALEDHNKQVEREKKRAKEEKLGELNELAAHKLRKDLGERYKGRTFVPRDAA